MPDSYKKLVQVNGLGVVEFPGEMQDDKIAATIKKHKAQTHSSSPHFTGKTTEESEHARQLKPAQPLDTAIPSLPQWANTPVLSGLTFDAQIERAENSGHTEQAEWLRKQKALQDKAYQKNIEKHPIATGVGEGVGETAEGLTSPANLALMITAPESKIMSGLFAIQALHGSYHSAQEAQEAYLKGNNAEASKYATQAILNLGIAGLAGHHAVKDIPVPESVKEFAKSEEGSVGPQGTPHPKEDNTIKILTDGKQGGYTLDYWLKNHPDVKILSVGKESIDPSTLHRLQGWTRESKLDEWKTSNATVKDMPPVEVVRTPHGDYLYDGTHRAEFATRQGEKVPATVYTIKNRNDATPAPNINDVKAKAAELKPTTAYKSADQSQPFYLKSENLIAEKMKGPMPAEDVHKMLLSNGVKPEEMKWTGLDELLQGKGKQKVTPQEIQEHLAGNNLQVQEVTKGVALGAKNPNELSVEEYGKPYDQLDAYQQRYIDTITEAHDKASPHATKFGSHVLPGAEPSSYREIVLTLPENRGNAARDARIAELVTERRKGIDNLQRLKSQLEESGYGPGTDSIVNEIRAQSAQIAKAEKDAADLRRDNHDSSFRSNHWPDEVNPIGHIRLNDRTGPNGEKILHLEELQSDWHQKGRKGRYVDPQKPFGVTTSTEHFATKEEADAWADEHNLKRMFVRDERVDRPEGAVPDAPFKKTWHELLLKRMVKYAAENGYDGISWTPGDLQAERYDLSKQIDSIRYSPYGNGKYEVDAVKDGRILESKIGTPQELEEFIGKDITQKIVNGEGKDHYTGLRKNDTPSGKELTGVDLKVGGEGMKGFYDKIIPDAANKLGKQWGAKVGETKIPTEENHRYEYSGPERTISDVESLHSISKSYGPDIHKSPFTQGEHIYAVNRVAVEHAARDVLQAMKNGAPFKKAMSEHGTPELAEYLGGKLDYSHDAVKKTVPYLPITPQMRAGVKSIPYSLFSIPLAAGALTLQQVKAQGDKLKKGVAQ